MLFVKEFHLTNYPIFEIYDLIQVFSDGVWMIQIL